MGREYRLSRDARLREEGDRRPARVPLDLRGRRDDDTAGHVARGSITVARAGDDRSSATDAAASAVRAARVTVARRFDGPIVGIDVGEDYLDLATVDAAAEQLRLVRVAVTGVDRGAGGAIGELRRRLLAAAPELGARGAVALIDSPRWPRDLDVAACAGNAAVERVATGRESASRAIDLSLRAIVSRLALQSRDGGPFRLSLFPTPRFEFFAACVSDPRCKPHLAAIGRELFGDAAMEPDHRTAGPSGGRIFTRFMLAGFAAYRALDEVGVESYEAYPDLAFRLWAGAAELPPRARGPCGAGRSRANRPAARG